MLITQVRGVGVGRGVGTGLGVGRGVGTVLEVGRGMGAGLQVRLTPRSLDCLLLKKLFHPTGGVGGRRGIAHEGGGRRRKGGCLRVG